MGCNAHGAYERTCHVHAYHEQPVLDMWDSDVAVFLDNILLYSCTVDEHFMLLEKVLAHLCQYTFYYKLKNCSFLHNSTTFLGFNVTPEGMHISD